MKSGVKPNIILPRIPDKAQAKSACLALEETMHGFTSTTKKTFAVIGGILAAVLVVGFATAHFKGDNTAKADDQGSPTATTQAQQGTGNGAVCRLDKIATFAEVDSAGPQRIEIGGGGTQHVDFYPNRGIAAVSYIVGPGKVMVFHGFGSIWEGNLPDCAQFDWVADATEYARGNVGTNRPDRLSHGHSGLVIDMRGNPKIVMNALGLNTQQIASLLMKHAQGMELTDSQKQMLMTIGTVAGATAPAAGSSPSSSGTCTVKEGVRADHKPEKGNVWEVTPTDSFRVVNLWSNQREPNLGDHKLLLKPGEAASLIGGGGAVWSYATNCGDAAKASYEANKNPAISLDQYQAYVSSGTMP